MRRPEAPAPPTAKPRAAPERAVPRPAPERAVPRPAARALLREAKRARRRAEKGEVRRFTRRSRRRRKAVLGIAATVGALMLFVGVTAFSPLMALKTIRVEGASRLDSSAITASLQGQVGRPLPLIDFGSVRDQLAGFVGIRSYSTESIPPHTLVVRVVERQPVGAIASARGYDLVDAAGVVLSSSPKPPKGYPVITAKGPGFEAAAAVLQALPTSLAKTVTAVTASTHDDVALTLHGGIHVAWGSADRSGLKADVLARLIAANKGRTISLYDVSSPAVAVAK